MTFFKAVRPDGSDFHTGTVDYGAALISGDVVRHPDPDLTVGPDRYLSVATVATDCTSMAWPCRLLLVEPVGKTRQGPDLPSKIRCEAVRVVGERPAHEALGPQGEHVAALIERIRSLTADEMGRLAAARDAARDATRAATWDATWDATRDATRDAARDAARWATWDATWDATWNAAWDAAWDAARDATWALLVRDLIGHGDYRTLVAPWASVCGWPHPDDEARYGETP